MNGDNLLENKCPERGCETDLHEMATEDAYACKECGFKITALRFEQINNNIKNNL